METVKYNGRALKFASKKPKSDKEIVIKAV